MRRGDNLTTIAKKFGTSANALIAANKAKVTGGGKDPNRIYSGLVLSVPGKAAGSANANSSSDGVNRSGGSAKASPSKSAPAKKASPSSSSGSSRGKSYSERKPTGPKPKLDGGGGSPKSSAERGGGRGKSYSGRGVGSPKAPSLPIKAGTGRKRGTAYKG